jgi:hypothetical protein
VYYTTNGSTTISASSSIIALARKKWENEENTAETWTAIADTSESWTPAPSISENWSNITPYDSIYAVPSSDMAFAEQAFSSMEGYAFFSKWTDESNTSETWTTIH